MQGYVTIENKITESVEVINKSRFIATATQVNCIADALQFISGVQKKYYDATHNCYAYIIGNYMKFSDDGEPQGTAGMPILDCIKKQGLNNVCVVVTRYFGGVKLGAGGLVRAYGGVASGVLQLCPKLNYSSCIFFEISVDYSLTKLVQRELLGKAEILDTIYGEEVTFKAVLPSEIYDKCKAAVINLCLGKAKITAVEEKLYPFVNTGERIC